MAEREFKEIILEYEARVRLSDMRNKQLEEENKNLHEEVKRLNVAIQRAQAAQQQINNPPKKD